MGEGIFADCSLNQCQKNVNVTNINIKKATNGFIVSYYDGHPKELISHTIEEALEIVRKALQ